MDGGRSSDPRNRKAGVHGGLCLTLRALHAYGVLKHKKEFDPDWNKANLA